MTACEERLTHLHALIDGELDAANSLAVEAHVAGCTGCAAELRRMAAIRDALRAPDVRYGAPTELREAVLERLEAETRREQAGPLGRAPERRRSWLAGGVGAAIAASLALVVVAPQLAAPRTEDELVASHVRSLLAAHLTDVATSDQHQVKPWFNGRVNFAPPTPDLAAQGFPLAGGRLDYLDHTVTPAIVYRRRLHVINLFVRPARGFLSSVGVASRRDGYSLIRWTQGGLEFWAVSDIAPDDLELFHRDFAAAAR